MSKRWAYIQLRIAKAFDKETVREVPASKLSIVLKTPVEYQDLMLSAARGGATCNRLEDLLGLINGRDYAHRSAPMASR